MDMTLGDYILNPMGKSNAVMSAGSRELQRKIYKANFDQVLLRENGRIYYTLYTDKKNNTYWAHIKVPSEHIDKFYYDVLFKFYADAEHGTNQDLFKWYVKFYSNDPAFVFTYAYTFNSKELLIPELKPKMSAKAMKEAAKEKNPQNNVGYVKIIYFAYLVMEMKNLNKLKVFENQAIPLSPQKIMSEVTPAEEKIEDRQSRKFSTRKKINVDQDTMRHLRTRYGVTQSNKINVTTTKKVGTIKNVNTVKRTKKIGSK